jgi:hypothetical protein
LTDLRKLFSPDIAERMVGVTPIGEGGRYREILTYLRATGAVGRRFVVVDDDPQSFPRGAPLLLVDPATGFGADAAKRLLEMARRGWFGSLGRLSDDETEAKRVLTPTTSCDRGSRREILSQDRTRSRHFMGGKTHSRMSERLNADRWADRDTR